MRRFSEAAMGGNTGGTVFLVNENCEGTGTPAGWIDDLGSPNWDYTTTVLAGAQSLFIALNGLATRVRIDFTDQSESWFYFLFRISGSAPGATKTIGGGAANGSTTVAPQFNVTSGLRLQYGTSSPATAISFDTTYHVWCHELKGTGANAVVDCGYSTTGVRPTSGGTYNQITNGTLTANVGRLFLGATSVGTFDCIFDNIRVATTQIGDNGS